MAITDLISHLIEGKDKGGPVDGTFQSAIHICLDGAAHRGPPGLFRRPFGIVFSVPFRVNDLQPVLPAQVIGDLPDALVVIPELVAVHFAIHKCNRIEYDMIVQMGFIQVRADCHFVSFSQKPSDKFTPDFMCLLRSYLSGLERLNHMIGQHMALAIFAPSFPGGVHRVAGIGRVTVESRYIQLVFGLIPVLGVVQKAGQIFL